MTLPWYPRDMGLYARDTKHLSLLEHGAYNLLMDHYYANGGLPSCKQCSSNAQLMPDHSRLYRLCSAISKDEQTAVDNVIEMYFKLSKKGEYVHKKCDEVIKEQAEKHERRVNAGRKGGQSNAASNANSKASQNQNQKKTKNKNESDSLNEFNDKDFLRENFDIEKLIDDSALTAAKKNAPGWDIYYLMGVYNEAIHGQKLEMPDKPKFAFPAWCKSFTKGKPPE